MANSSIGVVAIIAMLTSVALLAYPAWWMRVLSRGGVSRSDFALVQLPIAVTVMATLAVIPATLAEIGWTVIPTLVMLIAADYVLAHSAVVRLHEREGRLERPSVFIGFVTPQAILFLLVMAGAFWETFEAGKLERIGGGLGDAAVFTIVLLAGLPPLLAVVAIYICYRRHRRLMSRSG